MTILHLQCVAYSTVIACDTSPSFSIWAELITAHQFTDRTLLVPRVLTESSFFYLRHFSGRGQTGACGGRRRCARSRRTGADGAVPAQRSARPKPAASDSVHARAAVPAGAGVWQGELRL